MAGIGYNANHTQHQGGQFYPQNPGRQLNMPLNQMAPQQVPVTQQQGAPVNTGASAQQIPQEFMISSLQANIGNFVRITALLGGNILWEFLGTITEVGLDFIVLTNLGIGERTTLPTIFIQFITEPIPPVPVPSQELVAEQLGQ